MRGWFWIVISRKGRNNKRLEDDVEKYKKDYLYYFNEYLKLKDKDFKRNLDEMDQLKKNSLMHNARGAGRKAKFTDDQVDEIRRLYSCKSFCRNYRKGICWCSSTFALSLTETKFSCNIILNALKFEFILL